MTELVIYLDHLAGNEKSGIFHNTHQEPTKLAATLPGVGINAHGEIAGLQAWACTDPILFYDRLALTFDLHKEPQPEAVAMVVECIFGDLVPWVNIKSVAYGSRLAIQFPGQMVGKYRMPTHDIYSKAMQIQTPYFPDPLRVGDRVYLTYTLSNRSHFARMTDQAQQAAA